MRCTYKQINFTQANARINWLYTATGQKVQKTVKDANNVVTNKHYIGNVQYVDTEVDFIQHQEGRIIRTLVGMDVSNNPIYDYRYEYSLKDHLGNGRVFFSDIDKDGLVEVSQGGSVNELLQQEHYYPFGMGIKGEWKFVQPQIGGVNTYQYNGKELNDDFGLNWNDYGARWYDASIGRWNGVDPLAGQFNEFSPYNYTLNNPINFIDPDGKAPKWIPSINENTGEMLLTAERGDDLNSLIAFFGGPNEAVKYVPRIIIGSPENNSIWLNYSFAEGYSIPYDNYNNNYAEGVSYHFNVLNEGSGSVFQMLRCHNVAMLGSRGQSLVDIQDGSLLNSFGPVVRDKIIKEQYSSISSNEDGSFNFETEGTVGGSILTIGNAHTAVYFGTDKSGIQYFLNKDSTGDYSINSYEDTMTKWGSNPNDKVKAYTLKEKYKGTKLTDADVEE